MARLSKRAMTRVANEAREIRATDGGAIPIIATETAGGERLREPQRWYVRSEADGRMFVAHANRGLAWRVDA